MKIDVIKKRLNDEFNFSEIYESVGSATGQRPNQGLPASGQRPIMSESFEPGNILLIPHYREQQRHWINKAYNEWLRNDRTIVLICPLKSNCKYFKRYVTDVAQIRHIEGSVIYNNHRTTNPMIIAIYWKRVFEPNFVVSFD
jgi:hypothetical protein